MNTESLLREWNKAVAEDLVSGASMDRVIALTKQLREAGVFPPLLNR